jgi:hypothetical protein
MSLTQWTSSNSGAVFAKYPAAKVDFAASSVGDERTPWRFAREMMLAIAG